MTGTGKTVTRVDLCEAVYQKVGLSRTESSAFVELVLKEITDCLEKGETVKLSSFGSFMVRKKGQRIGRNPKTGTEVPISPRRVIIVKKPSPLMSRTETVVVITPRIIRDAESTSERAAVRLQEAEPPMLRSAVKLEHTLERLRPQD